MKPSDERERLQSMIDDNGQTWDLSDRDQAAIRWALAEVDRLTKLNDDKFAHLQAYCGAADEDRAEVATLKARLFTAEQANDLTRSMNAMLNAELKASEADRLPVAWTRTTPTKPGRYHYRHGDDYRIDEFKVFPVAGEYELYTMTLNHAIVPAGGLPGEWGPRLILPTIPAPEPSP